MLWIFLALLTGAAVLSVLLPLARAKASVEETPSDVAFYEAQVAEIERDVERGLIAPSDAESARTEAGRRLLAATRGGSTETGSSLAARRAAAVAAIVVIPAIALGLYGVIGNPGLPDQPLTARQAQQQPEQMDLAAAVARIEAHLAANPDDGKGYEVVAPVYLRMGRADDAARAYENAIRLLGDSPARRAGRAEAMVYAASGVVTADARKDFEAAVAADPNQNVARYYLGLAAEQDGDKAKAVQIWGQLLAEAPSGATWTKGLRARIAALDPSALPPESAPAMPQGEAAAAIAAMPEQDRQTAIRGMVDNLAARLAKDGNDVEGWIRLVRAYSVLKESEKAREALSNARRGLAADSAALSRIEALARELGLEG